MIKTSWFQKISNFVKKLLKIETVEINNEEIRDNQIINEESGDYQMSKNKSKKINEMKEEGKDIINQLGNEIIKDNAEIDALKIQLNKEENMITEENILINELGDKAISNDIEIGNLKGELVDDHKLINELGNEIVSDREKIGDLKDELIDDNKAINELENEVVHSRIEIGELKDKIINNEEISKLQRNEIIEDKVEINKLRNKILKGEITKMIEKFKDKKSDIENKLNRFVYIKVIKTIDPDISTLYLLKVIGIEIRFFIDPNEASKECRFMQKVIRNVIELGSDAKVEVKEIKTLKESYYLMKIAGKNIKVYTHQDEANRIAGYMQTVVDAVINATN